MGLFDFLTKKNAQTAVQRLAVKAADKRGLAPDRWEALQALIKIDSEEAVEALLSRFTFYVDPTITDQEEKDSVFNDDHGRETTNFLISFAIWHLVLAVTVVGLFLWPVIWVIGGINAVRGAIAAGRGEYFRYPMTLRFLN